MGAAIELSIDRRIPDRMQMIDEKTNAPRAAPTQPVVGGLVAHPAPERGEGNETVIGETSARENGGSVDSYAAQDSAREQPPKELVESDAVRVLLIAHSMLKATGRSSCWRWRAN